ncbi:putative aliphatic sulfonates-binding protein precursor [Variibacter gotjawalensis]|uniref:Putative aliphatic sulfonates-binding protein n=1 Tax=Variibacter gotjawalensis TaxID=1333996 RepID=A0A0S3Q152_9BRAD|nr:sulfonate ABC transporter substrate-binding protein [Variibacter gotjawalensis]NIK47756.1 sulfonate transport system substrate-binding protein [Variibacter gotjawalensis]RZS49645.1 sulfonate transport system substrate-binding protein [Variibacter gotjawalensis]BAT61909.1 putative aliphatic sulfonates-binding protein precursor [Variibacter gotjawalensis]
MNIFSALKTLALSALIAGAPLTIASAQDKVVRVGFQKYGNVILLKGKGSLEKKLAPLGYRVEWKEFPSGPPLIEALNVGAIDFGHTGESPPIFGQAAGAPFVYVAHEPPAPKGEAILVPKNSPIKTLGELKGKKVALNKGSNVHYLLVRALESAGVKYSEIEPIFLAPADARAAFERGAVDAWVIWDPFQAAAEVATQARTLADGTGLAPNHQFYLAHQKFADTNPQVIDTIVSAIGEIDQWASGNERAVAEELSPGIGIPAPILEIALKRQTYGIKPLDTSVVAEQQKIADTFFALGLLPKPILVSSIVRKAGS